MNIRFFVKRWLAPFRLKTISKYVTNNQKLNVLDIGCGNDSCRLTKKWLNVNLYHGVDKEYWHGNSEDYKYMDKVFFLDLENEIEKYAEIENEFYDVIIISHLIEHLKNGLDVIEMLLVKLKKGGIIYIETPHPRTLGYPSGIGFLNFHDESTHKMIYEKNEVCKKLLALDFWILKGKTRKDLVRIILLSPVSIILNVFYYLPFRRKIYATGLWDLLGVAFFVVAKK